MTILDLSNLPQVLQTPRVIQYLKRKVQRRGGPIYHKVPVDGQPINGDNFVMADSPECLRMAEEIGDRATAEFPAVYDKQTGFCDANGVPGDFHSVRCISQLGQDPLPIPLTDNGEKIKDEDLETDILPGDLPWLQELVRLFYGHAVPQNVHIRADGTTAAPDFLKDGEGEVVAKKLGFLKIVREFSIFSKLVSLKKGGNILEDFRVVFMHTIMSRLQPDKVFQEGGKWKTKNRLAPTPEEARSGAASNTYADKTARDASGNVIEGHFAMRMRDVFAFSGLLNYFISAIMGCFRAVYLKRFAATFKTRGAQDKQDRISKFKYVVGSDVKTMDKLVPRWFIDRFHAELTKYLDDRVVEIMRLMFKAPFLYMPNGTYKDGFNPLFGGNPLTMDFDNHPGLPSGIAQNPDIGKIWMVFCYGIAARDCGALHTPGDLEAWLDGRNTDNGLQDMADDAAFLTNFKDVATKFASYKSRYCIFEQEIPVIFLGDVYCEANGKKLVLPNPVSYVVNEIAREDSVANKPIALTALGRAAREEIYSRHPIYRDLKRIVQEAQMRHLGYDVTALYRKVPTSVAGRSDADLLFITNKAAIYYRLDPDDVSTDLLDSHMATVEAQHFWDDIRHLFKVPTAPFAAANDEKMAMKNGTYFN